MLLIWWPKKPWAVTPNHISWLLLGGTLDNAPSVFVLISAAVHQTATRSPGRCHHTKETDAVAEMCTPRSDASFELHRKSIGGFHLAATVWGGPGSVDETDPIHPLTQRIKAWSRPVEPTVEHRNVATCGLRTTLASAKGDGEEPSQPCVHRVIPSPAAELAKPFSIRQEALGQL